jgi:hypothetical protein|tara:strand:- start:65 stop:538 length:474 start_codon:yes stop_codon:yes gene_type:complete
MNESISNTVSDTSTKPYEVALSKTVFGTLFLVRGLPGSGKTQFVNDTMRTKEAQQIATDHFFYVDGIYEFDPMLLAENHQKCIHQVDQWMGDSTSWEIFVHNTFTQNWEMEPYYVLAEKYNWCVYSIIVENRHGGKSEHDVPDHSIKAMKERFEVQL